MPLFTVIIPTHDHADLVRVAAGSALAQTQTDLEIFIVGDGMDAATRLVAVELAGVDRRIRVFDFPKDVKRCARNRHSALQSAQGEYVAYLDDDDYWFPDHLQKLEVALAEADFAHTRLLMLHPHFVLQAYQDSLEVPTTRDRMLTEAYNFIGPTHTGHRLSTYRQLPDGWDAPVDDTSNDLNMWRKFLRQRGIRFRSSRAITTLHLPSSKRESWSLPERFRELTFWSRILNRPETRARIDLLFGENQEPLAKFIERGEF
jgi:glycosyltransferase involved in cell wall biosynthesis